MSTVEIADQDARLRALDANTSFIVQAPAGSGKTGLLTQRFIVLLAGVEAPEEITAITFTVKAAAEMRNRILQALERAGNDQAPDAAYDKQTWQLARKALARDKEKGWHLLENPSRLRIQTIDSLCTGLARQMPVLSRFGSVPAITKNANALYIEAARNAIAELEQDNEWADAIEHLLKHMDNQQNKVQELIATMLVKRDQWLRHIIHPDNPGLERENLEDAMVMVIEGALAELAELVPENCKQELLALARFAAGNLQAEDSPIAFCGDLQSLPAANVESYNQWLGIATLLLTAAGTWRKSVTKGQGFPAQSAAVNKDEATLYVNMKQRLKELLALLHEHEGFRQQLILLSRLPPQKYTDDEWQTLQALIKVLRLAVVNLEFVFKKQGKVDFSALTLAALNALGDDESPTDLALALDHRIQHLLVDEFQDTAFNQYDLLKKLTAGWQPGDGHTLFCVGDPMQSIYSFREADVGLFLDAKENGIGAVQLEFLNLSVNFRSQHGIVDWINQHFPNVMPAQDKASKSAVSYAASASFHPQLEGDAVTVYPSLGRDDLAEAKQLVSIVQQAKQEFPGGSTAIIVRSRSHLVQIIEQLQKATVPYQAVEIEGLAHRPVVQDLLALTRALNHSADRIAWLSVLRAPYCGLTLKDLYVLAADDSSSTIIDLLHQQQRIEKLSEDGQVRLTRVLPVLDAATLQQARSPLRNTVEGTWVELGGPACVQSRTDLNDAEVYFQLLEEFSEEGSEPDLQKLSEQVDKMYALPDVEADGSLQLITIHKAKGLEFDTVIMPGLGRTPPPDKSRLLHWLELGRQAYDKGLLLAPINALGDDKNKMATYLQLLDKEKRHYEDGRLLYVAATRAKKRLHLLGHTGINENKQPVELKDADKRALLGSLWPAVKHDFQSLFAKYDAESQQHEESESAASKFVRTRLVQDWTLPTPAEPVQITGSIKQRKVGELLEFGWAGETARHVGTVVHRLLQRISEMGVDNVTADNLKAFGTIGRSMLIRLGVPEALLEAAVERINTALQSTLKDEKGQWILNNQHQQSSCEYAISGVQDGRVSHMIIDRTFIDEKGVRWIIDYKTGSHTGGGIDEFLDREQERYRQQLQAYARAMSKLEDNPIRLALYFPLMAGWREWSV